MMKKFTLFIATVLMLGLFSVDSLAQLSGTYTIDPNGGDYTSFTAARNDLYSQGVSGAVTFQVAPGTYNERLQLSSSISGASATNTVTFDGIDKSLVTIHNTANNYSTIRFYQADYVTIKNMSILNTSGVCISFSYYADHNTIEDCHIESNVGTGSTTYIPIIFANSEYSYSSSYNYSGSYNKIYNNVIKGGYIGISIYSSSSSGGPYNVYNEIVGNEFTGQYYYSIRLYYSTGYTLIKDNLIHNPTYTSHYGIYTYYTTGNVIDGNEIHPGRYGIYTYRENYYHSTNQTYITNNMISGFTYTTYQMGIYLGYYSYYTHILHNSIICKGTSSSYSSNACLYAYYYPRYGSIKNNIFSAPDNYGFCIAMYYPYDLTCDYNNYYYNSGSYYKFYINTYFYDLNTFKSYTSYISTHDQNSTANNPRFTSDYDLHVQPIAGQQMEAPVVLPTGYHHDIDNDPRNSTGTTMIGCDQVPPYDLDIEELLPVVARQGNNDVTLTLKNKGLNAISAQTFTFKYKVDNGNWVTETMTTTSNWASGATKTFTFNQKWVVNDQMDHELTAQIDPQINQDADASDIVTQIVPVGMEGDYYIDGNGNGDYISFNEAVSEMNRRGIAAEINMYVMPGTYEERVVIPELLGASATSMVNFIGMDKDNTILERNATTNTDQSVVVFNGADYISFSDMTVQGVNGTYGVCFWFKDNADYNVISNCNIILPATTSSYHVHIYGGTDERYPYSTGYRGDNGFHNMIDGNNILGGGYYGGICWFGNSYNTNYDNTFKDNVITNQYYYSMYFYYVAGNKIIGNTIGQPRYTAHYAIYNYYTAADTILSNTINPGRFGIYQYYYNNYYNTSFYSLIANNMIYDFSDVSQNTGIFLYYYCYNQKIYNNTIIVDATSTSYYNTAIGSYYYPRYSDIKNNILISRNRSYVIALYYYPYDIDVDYNLYDYTSATPNHFYIHTSQYNNFNSYKSYTTYLGTHDNNSIYNVDPQIISDNDLHLVNGAKGYVGEYASFLEYDKDYDPRCGLQTNLGADEPYRPEQTLDFIAEDTMCYLTPITFYNTALEDQPHEVDWYVNGSKESSDFNFTRSFTQTGYDTVEMQIQTCYNTDTITKHIYINTPSVVPTSEFMADVNIVEVGDMVNLIDLTDFCPSGWHWQISPYELPDPNNNNLMAPAYQYINNTDSTFQNPQVSFNFPGTYTVKLTTSNVIGSSAMETKTDYINVKFSDVMCGQYMESSERYGSLYDDGGNSSHGTYNNCSYLIKPCTDDVKITFEEFNLGSGAYLRLYDGADAKGTPLWDVTAYGPNGLYGSISNASFDTTILATESGMVYVEFESAGSTGLGFKLAWEGIGTGSYTPPQASFASEDTGCIVYPFYYENTSFADKKYSRFMWDYDGNGFVDDYSLDGMFQTTFPGISAIFNTRLMVENCGGVDTFEKSIILVNPQADPKDVEIQANLTNPVKDQDAVILRVESDRMSCVNTFEWDITPTTYYFVNQTNKYSANPQVIFTDTVYYSVSVKTGNSNAANLSTTVSRPNYIKPKSYCNPIVLNQHQDIGINRVILKEINHVSTSGLTAYSNFSNQEEATLIIGQPYDLTIERNTNFNKMERVAWIDYNNDGEFSSTEMILHEGPANTLSYTGNFTVPIDADFGATSLRVAAVYSGSNLEPCGPVIYGEYEDYRVYISQDNVPPVITLNGNDTLYIEKGYAYIEDSAMVIDNLEGDISDKQVITGSVDNMVLGGYFIYYDAMDSLGNEAETVERLVVITEDNTPPVITLYGDPAYVNVNKPFNDTAFMAYDMGDGDITDQVVITGMINTNKLGEYELTYTVTDSRGLSDTKTRTVIVSDVAAPDITLNGDDTMYIEIMTPFNDPGVTYSDNYWPMNRITYQKSGIVDTTKIGTYTVSYSVTDASQNGPNTVTRTVIVWDSTAPTITLSGYDEVEVEVNTPFVDPGVIIDDNSVSGYTVTTSGTYYQYFMGMESPDSIGLFSIFYIVEDEAGNVSNMIARVVNVVDIRCPDLKLNGDAYTSVEKWTKYDDLGYTVTDNYYSLSEITVDTTINVSTDFPGLYQVSYTAEDPSNRNCPTVVRMVKVVYNNVSIDENDGLAINIYPNPTTGRVVAELGNVIGKQVDVTVVDMLGEEVMVLNRGITSKNQFEIDLSTYASGVYMLKVQTAENTVLERIVLSK